MEVQAGHQRAQFPIGMSDRNSYVRVTSADLEAVGTPKPTAAAADEALRQHHAVTKRGGVVTRVLTSSAEGPSVGYQALAAASDDPAKGLFGRWRPDWAKGLTSAEVSMRDGLAEPIKFHGPLSLEPPGLPDRGNVMGELRSGTTKELIGPEHVVAYGPAFDSRAEARAFAIEAAKRTGTPMQVWPGDLPLRVDSLGKGQYQVNQLGGLQALESAADGVEALQLKPHPGMAGALVVTADGTPIEVAKDGARLASLKHGAKGAAFGVFGLATFAVIGLALTGGFE